MPRSVAGQPRAQGSRRQEHIGAIYYYRLTESTGKFLANLVQDFEEKLKPDTGMPESALRPTIPLGSIATHTSHIPESEYFLWGRPLDKDISGHYATPSNDAKIPKKFIDEDCMARRRANNSLLLQEMVRGLVKHLLAPTPLTIKDEEKKALAALSTHLVQALTRYHVGKAIHTRVMTRHSMCGSSQASHKHLIWGKTFTKILFYPNSADKVHRATQGKSLRFGNRQPERPQFSGTRQGGQRPRGHRPSYDYGGPPWGGSHFFRGHSSSIRRGRPLEKRGEGEGNTRKSKKTGGHPKVASSIVNTVNKNFTNSTKEVGPPTPGPYMPQFLAEGISTTLHRCGNPFHSGHTKFWQREFGYPSIGSLPPPDLDLPQPLSPRKWKLPYGTLSTKEQ